MKMSKVALVFLLAVCIKHTSGEDSTVNMTTTSTGVTTATSDEEEDEGVDIKVIVIASAAVGLLTGCPFILVCVIFCTRKRRLELLSNLRKRLKRKRAGQKAIWLSMKRKDKNADSISTTEYEKRRVLGSAVDLTAEDDFAIEEDLTSVVTDQSAKSSKSVFSGIQSSLASFKSKFSASKRVSMSSGTYSLGSTGAASSAGGRPASDSTGVPQCKRVTVSD